MTPPVRRRKTPAAAETAQALYRSGAVAQMLHMPVATLRVWERRYALTNTALSPSGQRLYSAGDVRRLALLKQLSDQGHAIGSLAPLTMEELQDVSATHAQALALTQPEQAPHRPESTVPWRLAVVGRGLASRLQRPALLRHLDRALQVLGPFDDVAQAAAALAAPGGMPAPDAWLLHQPQLHDGWWAAAEAAVPAWRPDQDSPVPVAVLYGFAADAVCEAVADRGVALLREPQPDVALAQWLRRWAAASPRRSPAEPAGLPTPVGTGDATGPRRWDEAALARFAAQSSTVPCECPRQVAELLLQLSRFETYSVQCQHRSPGDARLHAFLAEVAGASRARFEQALEQVARHEGLRLPVSPG